jgi:VIT1/CCC1 family predicted Fe2+/Mn2+ transporter
MTSKLARKYLSFTDRIGEVAFAVIMVIIINGYVALSNLNSGFLYIVVVNIGACAAWGFIDGFIYAISSSIERNNLNNKIFALKKISGELQSESTDKVVALVESKMGDDDFFNSFDEGGKKAIANNIVHYAPQATVQDNKVFTKEDVLGWFSINLIYLTVGFLLALPFFVFPDKLVAWFVSNLIGVAWLFWYGFQLGRSVGKYKIALGFGMSAIGILFLIVSYIAWVG